MANDFRLLSVIIPVFNERSTVAELIDRILRVEIPIEMEIIVVDDGSNDGTLEILKTHVAIKHLYLSPVNIGKGAAIRIGLSFASGDIILLQDADLELDPSEYAELLKPIFNGESSVVYGSRFLTRNRNIPLTRRAANSFLTTTTNILYNCRLTDMETAYQVFTADVIKDIALHANRFEIEPEITARIRQAGFQIHEVPVSYSPRTVSEGKKIKWQDGLRALVTLLSCRLDSRSPRSDDG